LVWITRIPTIRIGGEVLQHEFDDFGGSGLNIDATTAALRVSLDF
jgi:outer membrane immunogenic protein